MTERAQTACCHASEVVYQSEAPEQSEDRGVVRGDDDGVPWVPTRPRPLYGSKNRSKID